MKSRMLLSPLWKIGSWKKLFVCGKKSLEKPKLELNATLELPHEIYEIIEWEILPRLPAKSLGRFMCVCKQWKSLISTYDFTRKNLHYLKNKQPQTHRKLLEIDNLSTTFSTSGCDDDSTTTRSISFVNGANWAILLANLDGLIFVQLLITDEYAFWNPLTGAYKKFPNSPTSLSLSNAYGLYFDSDKKDYKVLEVTSHGGFKAFIYSQRLNSTKEIGWLENHQLLSDLIWSASISYGESLYFLGRHYNNTNYHNQYWIIVFDVKSEKFREIHFPLLNQENAYQYASLMVIKGCMHIFVATYIYILKTGFMETDGELWRMDGDADDWTKVKDFQPAGNQYPLTYDEKIDMEDLARNFNQYERFRKMLYLETLVSPSN